MSTFIKYRGNKHVVVRSLGLQKSGPHKGEVKLKTLETVGKRPKGSIDYRKPDKVYHS